MQSLILRTATPILVSLTLVYSIFVLFRGHNEPGGGFIGGLIAASAIATYAIAFGPEIVRRAIKVPPMAVAAVGVLMAFLSGVPAILLDQPYFTGQWPFAEVGGALKNIATPVVFDIGVYLVVVGTIAALVLSLEEDE